MPTFSFDSLTCHKFATSSWSGTLWIESTNRSKQPNTNNNNINIEYFNLENKVITLHQQVDYHLYLCWFGCLGQIRGGLINEQSI